MPSREPGRSPRQVFGGMLRYYREQAGLSRTELGRQISKSVSLVQAIELGQRAATPDVTEDLEAALATGGALTRLRTEIGDGLGYQVFPAWFQDWAIKETEAATLRWFEPLIIPGLLQPPFHSNFFSKLGGVIASQRNAARLFDDLALRTRR